LRIEDRLYNFRERFLERRDGDLGGACAVRMTAHTVDDDQEQGFAARDNVQSILVFRPMARQSQLCMIDAHSSLPPWFFHCPLCDRELPRKRTAEPQIR